MKIVETALPGILVLEPKVFGDERGFFVETYRKSVLREAGVDCEFVQDNQSRSSRGVLRGLHFQLEQAQAKLVRVARGRVFDVAVDIRRGSPSFGQWFGTVLDDQNQRAMYVPENFAHGFLVMSESADLTYKCSNYYHAASDNGIAWNDPDIGIEWPELGQAPTLSAKDAGLCRLAEHPQLPAT